MNDSIELYREYQDHPRKNIIFIVSYNLKIFHSMLVVY